MQGSQNSVRKSSWELFSEKADSEDVAGKEAGGARLGRMGECSTTSWPCRGREAA